MDDNASEKSVPDEQPTPVAETAAEQPSEAPAEEQSTEAAEAPAEEQPAEPAAPKPSGPKSGAPKPGAPKPGAPKPGAPRPGAPRPAAVRPTAVSAPPSFTEEQIAAAAAHGRADADGTVHVTGPDGERTVGQLPESSPEEALAYFARKHLEAEAQVSLLEQRLHGGAQAAEIEKTAKGQRDALAEAATVGDHAALAARLETVIARAQELAAEQRQEAERLREEARVARAAIVERAEELAGGDPERIQWKSATREMNVLFDEWKRQQSQGPKLSRSVDQELWKRFSAARTTLDRHRREFFSALHGRNQEGKKAKEALIAEAEALAQRTEWRETAQAYRELMDRWRAAPRAEPKEDDRLWARFRAAQDVFFAARDAHHAELDTEYQANLVVKEELLVEAKTLVPVKDLEQAKRRLRDIQDRWEQAGKVPRNDLRRVEDELRGVERQIAEAESVQWERSNPETRARTSSALTQIDQTIAQLEADLEKAKSGGSERKIAAAEEALAARRAWREQIARAAEDFA